MGPELEKGATQTTNESNKWNEFSFLQHEFFVFEKECGRSRLQEEGRRETFYNKKNVCHGVQPKLSLHDPIREPFDTAAALTQGI